MILFLLFSVNFAFSDQIRPVALLLVESRAQLELWLDGELKECSRVVDCDRFFVDNGLLGAGELCLASRLLITAKLGPDSAVSVNKSISIRQLVTDQCKLNTTEISKQPSIKIKIKEGIDRKKTREKIPIQLNSGLMSDHRLLISPNISIFDSASLRYFWFLNGNLVSKSRMLKCKQSNESIRLLISGHKNEGEFIEWIEKPINQLIGNISSVKNDIEYLTDSSGSCIRSELTKLKGPLLKSRLWTNGDEVSIRWNILDIDTGKLETKEEKIRGENRTDLFFPLNSLISDHLFSANMTATSDCGFTSNVVRFRTEPLFRIDFSPKSNLRSIETKLFVSVNPKAPNWTIRFGIASPQMIPRLWTIRSTLDFAELLIPSNRCDHSSKYGQIVAELCNKRCFFIRSLQFEVNNPTAESTTELRNSIQRDIQVRDLFDSCLKFGILKTEECEGDTVLADSIGSLLLDNWNNGEEKMECLGNILRFCSPNILSEIVALIQNSSLQQNHRPKRNVKLVNAMTASGGSSVTESVANSLLVAYDLLVSRNQNVVGVYLTNIIDLLSGFCVQTDSTRTMSASGQNYTIIQMQELMPGYKSFLSTDYSLAGTSTNTIIFGKDFQKAYGDWSCSGGTVSCSEICLGTVRVKTTMLEANAFMASYFSPSSYNGLSMKQLVSDLFEIILMDPVSGKEVPLSSSVSFTVRIPLVSYVPALYYNCFLFTGTSWLSSYCVSATYGTKTSSGIFELECTCRSAGFIAVFIVPPPKPIAYPPYNEVFISLQLSKNVNCSESDQKTFIQNLANSTALDESRFVRTNCSNSVLTTVLRPAFKENQTSNSYAMQSITKALLAPTGFLAFGDISVSNVSNSVILRNLSGDGNARRIPLRIDRSFKDTVGNDSTLLAASWISSLSANMRISPFRFKNPVILIGMLFNFTITVPFVGENADSVSISAEELSMWICSQTEYGEIDLHSQQNERMPIERLYESEVVELVVSSEATLLTVILSSFVAISCILITLCASGFVFVKIRTDRFIETHNRNLRNPQRTN